MSYSRRTDRHRNPKQGGQPKAADSFFSSSAQGAVQAKRETPFFQAKLTTGQPGDQYEQEADAMASQVAGHPANGAPNAIRRKEIGRIQRQSASKQEEEAGTDEERMRRDKEIQTKPDIQQMNDPGEEQEKVQRKTQEEEKDEMKGAQ